MSYKHTVKPSVPAVFDRFRAYHARWPVWGVLHIVLDDLNVENRDVEYASLWAREFGDEDGFELARILRAMSRTQRRKLARTA